MSVRELPPIASVRVFDAAARLGSFTAAADELAMTQAAVSYQIKLLEERIGAKLFERRARGVVLTTTGQKFATHVATALDLLGDAYAEARGSANGTLTVSVIPTFATNFLARRIGSFQIDNPDIAVRFEISETLVDLSAGTYDVAIRAGKGNWPGNIARLLIPNRFTPLLSPALAARSPALKNATDLFVLPILSQAHPWWKIWFDAADAQHNWVPVDDQIFASSQVVEAQAAIAGQGVALLTPAFFQEEIAGGHLIQPFDVLGDDGSGYYLVYPEGRRNSAKIRKFRQWLEKETQPFRTDDRPESG